MGLTWILLVMLAMVGGSIIVELILPMSIKDRLGAIICWTMRAATMTFLGLATVLLVFVLWTEVISPKLFS